MSLPVRVLVFVVLATAGVFGSVDEEQMTYLTTLVSPNFPDVYPHDTNQEWIVETATDEKMTIVIYSLHLERFWDMLSFTHTSLQDHIVTSYRLGTNTVTSLFLSDGHLEVQFCSDRVLDFNGFALNIFATRHHINDSSNEDFLCASGTQSISNSSRCDQIVDCHDLSDEHGCGDCPDASFHCLESDVCILPRLHCDGWPDCPYGDDEEMCETLKCPAGCSCGESAFNDGWGPRSQPCSKPTWLPFWVNCSTNWNEHYAQHSAIKSTVINLRGTALFDTLDKSAFYGLHQLHAFYLDSCQLEYLPPGVFRDQSRVWRMALSNNSLTFLANGTFEGLTNLRALYMEDNLISILDEGCFRGLHNIIHLDLEANKLSNLRHGTFADLGGSLERIVFEDNMIRSINSSLFAGLEHTLEVVNFQGNPIEEIAPQSFIALQALEDLHILSANTISLYPEIFQFGPNFQTIFVFDPRICCIMPDTLACNIIEPPHPLFTCRKTFLQNTAVKVFIWILGVSALIGNAIVIIMRLTNSNTRSSSSKGTSVATIQSTLITNLAVADFLMGVYMVILAVMDLVIGDTYFWEGRAQEWRASLTCQIAGFISFLSSEASVLMLTLISVDRFICIIFPFTLRRLTVSSARVAVCIIWIASLLLDVGSILVNRFNPDAYSLSDVCVGLPLIRKLTDFSSEFDSYTYSQFGHTRYNIISSSSISTWQFSIAVFLGLNLISFVIILLCYVAIFIKVRLTRKELAMRKSGENAHDDVRMALKMSLIVGTDFFCWMPIIILGILVQADIITLSADVYAWLVVFVLPINSSLNPFMYTLIERIQK